MNCSLGDLGALSREEISGLQLLISFDLNEMVEKKQPFQLKKYMKSVYDIYNQDSHEYALAHAILVPSIIDQIAAFDTSVSDYFDSINADFNALKRTIKKLRDPSTSIETIESYINLPKAAEAPAKPLETEKIEEKKPQKKVLQGGVPTTRIDVAPFVVNDKFDAAVATLFSSTVFETLSPTKGHKDYHIINAEPKTVRAAKVTRNIVRKLMSAGVDYKGSKVYNGVYATLMRSNKIEEKFLYPGYNSQGNHNEGVSVVLTDREGNPLLFDDNGEPTYDSEKGFVIYYNIRQTNTLVDAQGNVKELNKYDLKTRDSLVTSSKISVEAATEKIKNEIKAIHIIRQAMLADENLKVVNEINGGSLGLVTYDLDMITPSDSIVLVSGQQFIPEQPKAGETIAYSEVGVNSAAHVIRLDSMYDQPVALERGLLSDLKNLKGESLLEPLLSIFIDPLVQEDNLGKLVPISQKEREKLVLDYFYTSSDTVRFFETPEGKRTIKIQGVSYSLDTAEERLAAKAVLRDSFTKSISRKKFDIDQKLSLDAQRELIKSKRDGKGKLKYTVFLDTDPNPKQSSGFGRNVMEVPIPGTSTPRSNFYIIEKAKFNIVRASISNNVSIIESTTENEDGTFTVNYTKNVPYNEFVRANTFINYDLNAANHLLRLNPYLTYAPIEGELNKVYGDVEKEIVDEAQAIQVPPSTLTDESSVDKSIDEQLDSLLDKNKDQKGQERKATKEQIEAAKVWYENHPLNKYFPFEVLFNAINTKRPWAAATWTMDGITLFKGADYSDLYHEAWHGFSQAFLNHDQKRALYKETAKKTGTFKAYDGSTVSFSKATDKQLEEFLAEDFRNYMLNGQKVKQGAPVRNTIFRKIFNFLKTLFGKLTVREVVENDRANGMINELYEKLRVGNLSEYTFAQKNVQFGTLDSTVRPLDINSKIEPLNYQDSMKLVRMMNSLMSEGIDFFNNQLKSTERAQLAVLKAKLATNTLTTSERKDLEETLKSLESKQTYQYTSSAFTDQAQLKKLYKYVLIRLGALLKTHNDKLAVATDPQEIADLTKRVQLLGYAVSKEVFGDVENLSNNLPDKDNNVLGLIGYHKLKSQILDQGDVTSAFEEVNEQDKNQTNERDGLNRLGNSNSLQDLAKKEIKALLHTLYKVENGKIVYDEFGVADLTPFKDIWNRLVRTIAGRKADEMERLMKEEAKSYPAILQLLNKLGPLTTQSLTEDRLWTAFFQTFAPSKISLIQLTTDESVREVVINGVQYLVPYYETTVGEATGSHARIGRMWENSFKLKPSEPNPYIEVDDQGTYLNTAAVLEAFPEETLYKNRFEFFRAIGFELSDVPALRKELDDKDIGGAEYYRNKLVYLHDKNIPIRRFEDLNKEYEVVVKNGKLISDLLATRFKQLEVLELRYSDRNASHMVSTATGNSQSEYSLNNTLTQIVYELNNAVDYQTLIANPATEQFDVDKNPAMSSSIILNSLFKIDLAPSDPQYGKRRRISGVTNAPFVQLELTNLSGVLLTKNGETTGIGVESAKSDPFTKMITDFHLMIQQSRPELMRHGDKASSYSNVLSHFFVNGEFKSNYIPNTAFFNDSYKNEALGIFLPYIAAELTRVNMMRNPVVNGMDKNFDQGYVKRGSKFVAFDTMLSESTKETLYDLKMPLEIFLLSRESIPLREAINNDIQAFFDKRVKNLNKKFNKANFISSKLLDTIKESLSRNTKEAGLKNADIQLALLRSLDYNTWIHNYESMAILHGDIAQFDVYKDAVTKRISGIASTGDISRLDPAKIEFINKVLTRDYAKKLGAPITPFNGTFATAVIQDKVTTSAYISEFEKALGKSGAEKYRDMEEGDGMAWISFDSYRILRDSQGKWLPEHEAMYQNIVNGVPVDEASVRDIFFPVIKEQYYGPLKTEKKQLPLTAFHKFQLFPLIPTVIKNSPTLTALHDKMTREQVDYVLFKSASKLSTVTAEGTVDDIYNNDTRQLTTNPFTKNVIFLNYLKDQLEMGSTFKGTVTFPTQLRAILLDGLWANGVPIDYTGTVEEWDALSDKQKRIASPKNYVLTRDFEKAIAAITAIKKKSLLKKAGWKVNDKGKLEGSMADLIKFIKVELQRQDIGDHEIDFLAVHNNEIKIDLSIAPFAEKVDKLLNNIIAKELINQKVTGEALVQVASALFENAASIGRNYTNPTKDDLDQWGSNDLPFYHKNPDGTTAAMKVKVALQGEFRKLLKLKHKDGFTIDTIDRLNEMIQDNEWLDTRDIEGGSNRRFITMAAVRTPLDGINLTEFMEVYEFLDPKAGNIIITSPEIVAKTGSDFDIDKLSVLMPSFNVKKGIVSLKTNYESTSREARLLYDEYKKAKVEQRKRLVASNKKIGDKEELASITRQMIRELKAGSLMDDSDLENLLLEENLIDSFDDFLDKYNGTKGIENDLIWTIKSILELESNYEKFIRPNDVVQAKTIANDLKTLTGVANSSTSLSGSNVLGYEFNHKKHNTIGTSKASLGMGAIKNKWGPLLNRVGAYLNPSAGISTQERNRILAKQPKERTDEEKDALRSYRRQRLFVEHGTKQIGSEVGIMLSGLTDVNGVSISEMQSQLMNGWLDVAKDDWIAYLQANIEVTPVLEFLLQAEVPLQTAAYLVSLPMVRAYIEERQKASSTFAEALGKAPSHPSQSINAARVAIFNNPLYGFRAKVDENSVDEYAYTEAIHRIDIALVKDKFFDPAKLRTIIEKQKGHTDYERAAFLHFLEIENMAEGLNAFERALNADTTKSDSFFSAQNRIDLKEALLEDARWPAHVVNKILTESPISSFFIQEFQLDIWAPIMPLRTSKAIKTFLKENTKGADVAKTFGDKEIFNNMFHNDLISYIFQNSIGAIDLNTLDSYRGLPVVESDTQTKAIVVTATEITINKEKLINQWKTKALSNTGIVEPASFKIDKEYFRFAIEHAYLEFNEPLEVAAATIGYEIKYNFVADTIKQKAIGESITAFEKRRDSLVYDLYIRDKAFDNTNNMWKLFSSDNTYGEQFMILRKKFPFLNKYDIVKQMDVRLEGKRVNLTLSNTQLESDDINTYHENLIDLANPQVFKSPNKEENEFISDFFKRFATVAFLQSGLNTKTIFSLGRIIPTQELTMLVDKASKDYLAHFDAAEKKGVTAPILTDFYNRFVRLNSNYTTRVRGKNFESDVTLAESIEALEKGTTLSEVLIDSREELSIDTKETARTIYAKLGDVTQSKNVEIPGKGDLKAVTYDPKTFWSEVVPEARGQFGDKLIIAYRGKKTNTFLQNYKGRLSGEPALTIGNPFDWQNETGTIKEKGIKSTKKFIHWMITGDNMGVTAATEEYRQAIIDSIKSGELKGRPIIYYQEKGYATHATALDYLIHNYDWDTGRTNELTTSVVFSTKSKEVMDNAIEARYPMTNPLSRALNKALKKAVDEYAEGYIFSEYDYSAEEILDFVENEMIGTIEYDIEGPDLYDLGTFTELIEAYKRDKYWNEPEEKRILVEVLEKLELLPSIGYNPNQLDLFNEPTADDINSCLG